MFFFIFSLTLSLSRFLLLLSFRHNSFRLDECLIFANGLHIRKNQMILTLRFFYSSQCLSTAEGDKCLLIRIKFNLYECPIRWLNSLNQKLQSNQTLCPIQWFVVRNVSLINVTCTILSKC